MPTNYFCDHCKNTIPTTRKHDSILIHGAKEHNLKNVCLEMPKGKLVALTGPSGSGKSSIATDILQGECIRQYLESLGMTTDHIEKAKVDLIMGLSPSIGVPQRVTDFNPRSTVGTKVGTLTILRNLFATMGHQPCTHCGKYVKQPLQDKRRLTTIEIEQESGLSLKKKKKDYFECPACKHQLEKLTMGHFSFNTATGACATCKGAGKITSIDFSLLLNEEKSIRDGGIIPWNSATAKHYETIILAACNHYNFAFEPALALKNYTQEQKNFLLYGVNHPDFVKAHPTIKPPKKVSDGNFEGVIPPLLNLFVKNPIKAPSAIKKFMIYEPCTECQNTRLSGLGKQAMLGGKTIIDVANLDLTEFLKWIHDLEDRVGQDELSILSAFSGALKERTSNLIEVGLHYLTLDRSLPILSAGEAQRLKLANLLGCGLTGVLYVLDEPTTGLHPADTEKLLKTLRMLQEAGNSVLVIEHDPDVIKTADYIIDMGPGGGTQGGQIVASGTIEEIIAHQDSLTGQAIKSYVAKTGL